MNIKKAATSTIAAGFVGAAMLGLGVTAGTASAAPAQQQVHSQQQPGQQRQREVTITRTNYRPFVYQGHRVTPRYDAARGKWGFTVDRTFVHVVLARR